MTTLIPLLVLTQNGLTFKDQMYTGIARCRPPEVVRLRRMGDVLTRHRIAYQLVASPLSGNAVRSKPSLKVREYELWVAVSDTARATATIRHAGTGVSRWLAPRPWPIAPKKTIP